MQRWFYGQSEPCSVNLSRGGSEIDQKAAQRLCRGCTEDAMCKAAVSECAEFGSKFKTVRSLKKECAEDDLCSEVNLKSSELEPKVVQRYA